MVGVKHCTPYADGSGYFIGADCAKGSFPYATGPVCHVAKRDDKAIIPERVILNWMFQLCLTPKDIAMFWGSESHATESENDQQPQK
jgi:hypothetical protein